MRMKVDTSEYVIGGVLSIDCEDRRWRSLNETEINYKIHDKKMGVVIRQLENWRHLLKGAKYKFKVWTNHKNLEYFMKKIEIKQKTSLLSIIYYICQDSTSL